MKMLLLALMLLLIIPPFYCSFNDTPTNLDNKNVIAKDTLDSDPASCCNMYYHEFGHFPVCDTGSGRL